MCYKDCLQGAVRDIFCSSGHTKCCKSSNSRIQTKEYKMKKIRNKQEQSKKTDLQVFRR